MISGIVKALKRAGSGYWMALPALLAIWRLSHTRWPSPPTTACRGSYRYARRFVGLENYSRMLQDPDFAEALGRRSCSRWRVGVSLSWRAGARAVASRPFAGRGVLAVVAFLPWVFPPVVVAPSDASPCFVGSVPWAMPPRCSGSVTAGCSCRRTVCCSAWPCWWTPGVPRLRSATSAGRPRDHPRGGLRSRAGRWGRAWQRFISITLPLLKPALLVVLLLRLLDAFRVFDLFRVLGNRTSLLFPPTSTRT